MNSEIIFILHLYSTQNSKVCHYSVFFLTCFGVNISIIRKIISVSDQVISIRVKMKWSLGSSDVVIQNWKIENSRDSIQLMMEIKCLIYILPFYYKFIPLEGNDSFDLSFDVESAPNMDVATEIRISNLTQWNMFCSYVTFSKKKLPKNKNKKCFNRLILFRQKTKSYLFSYYKAKL